MYCSRHRNWKLQERQRKQKSCVSRQRRMQSRERHRPSLLMTVPFRNWNFRRARPRKVCRLRIRPELRRIMPMKVQKSRMRLRQKMIRRQQRQAATPHSLPRWI